jgi:GAF domain-containing protein
MTENTHADPVTDVERLKQVARFDLESPELREVLHGFAQEAAELLERPVGLVSIVLDGAQFLAGSFGLDGTWLAESEGTPVEWAFCANAVRSGEPYVVEDAATDPAHLDNPLVLIDGIRSYAGAPLVTPTGYVLGTCCTLDFEPHTFSPEDVAVLEELSGRIVVELERHAVERRRTPRD